MNSFLQDSITVLSMDKPDDLVHIIKIIIMPYDQFKFICESMECKKL